MSTPSTAKKSEEGEKQPVAEIHTSGEGEQLALPEGDCGWSAVITVFGGPKHRNDEIVVK